MIEARNIINIKEITLRESLQSSAKDLVFDPERDIDDNHWSVMKDFLKFERHKNWGEFASIAASMYLLFPDRRKELNVGRTTRDHLFWSYSADDVESRPDITDLKLLYGRNTRKLISGDKQEISEDNAIYIIKLVQENIKNDGLKYLARDIIDIFILSPKIVSKLKNIDGLCDLFIKKIPYNEDSNMLASVSFAGRLLNPATDPIKSIDKNKLEEFKLACISKIENHESYLKAEIKDALRELAYLKLLTAHEVKSTPNGLDIVMQPRDYKFENQANDIPIFRRF
jgi:hypothetical protein